MDCPPMTSRICSIMGLSGPEIVPQVSRWFRFSRRDEAASGSIGPNGDRSFSMGCGQLVSYPQTRGRAQNRDIPRVSRRLRDMFSRAVMVTRLTGQSPGPRACIDDPWNARPGDEGKPTREPDPGIGHTPRFRAFHSATWARPRPCEGSPSLCGCRQGMPGIVANAEIHSTGRAAMRWMQHAAGRRVDHGGTGRSVPRRRRDRIGPAARRRGCHGFREATWTATTT